MSVNKEGLTLIVAVALVSSALACAAVSSRSTILATLAALGFAKAAFFCYFFRDPERKVVADPAALLAPADGTVMEIADEENGAKTVRVFLSVFNVHVQRAPIEGVVKNVERAGTKYLAAMKPEAHRENVRNIVTIEGAGGGIFKVHQIVGVLARRLVLWVNPGQTVRQGERIGMIKFGSQVDLTLPAGYEIAVKPGDKTAGGLTVIARKK